jgi:anti-sigma-K factor RskA
MNPFPEDYISGYLDGQSLTTEERQAFEQMLTQDSTLRAEVEAMQHLKARLQQGVREGSLRPHAPEAAREAVLKAMLEALHTTQHSEMQNNEQNSEQNSEARTDSVPSQHGASQHGATPYLPDQPAMRFKNFINAQGIQQGIQKGIPNGRERLNGALRPPRSWRLPLVLSALAMVCIGLGYALVQWRSPKNADTTTALTSQRAQQDSLPSFRAAALKNYSGVRSGTITLQHATSSFEDLQNFFRSHGIAYTLIQPKLHATLLGGVVSEENGVKSAHLVYQTDKAHKNAILYLWQIPEHKAASGLYAAPTTVSVDTAVSHIIHRKGEWYWERAAATLLGAASIATLAVWEDRATFCILVSDLPQAEMMALML